jgi:hypothetical protein
MQSVHRRSHDLVRLNVVRRERRLQFVQRSLRFRRIDGDGHMAPGVDWLRCGDGRNQRM